MKKILQLTHEGAVRGDYTQLMSLVMTHAEHYCDAKLEKFHLDTEQEFETALYFEFIEPMSESSSEKLLESLQIELMDTFIINFYEPQIPEIDESEER